MDKSDLNAQNVLDMSDYQPETGYAAISQVEAYWHAIRGTRDVPNRSDIDPRGIELALEYAFIVERVARGVARLRIAGNHLNELMGAEVRGMPLTGFISPSSRKDAVEMIEKVFQGPAVGTMELNSAGSGRQTKLDARLILLPLKSDLGDISRALGCLVSKGAIRHAPRRFDVTSCKALPIGSAQSGLPAVRTTPEAGLPVSSAPPRKQPPGLAEPEEPFANKKSGKKRPPYLRVVQSDD